MDTHTPQRPWACLYRLCRNSGATVVNWVIALLIFALALAVYNATLTPSLSYKSPDGNELARYPTSWDWSIPPATPSTPGWANSSPISLSAMWPIA
jgi:hypothetical protein